MHSNCVISLVIFGDTTENICPYETCMQTVNDFSAYVKGYLQLSPSSSV